MYQTKRLATKAQTELMFLVLFYKHYKKRKESKQIIKNLQHIEPFTLKLALNQFYKMQRRS